MDTSRITIRLIEETDWVDIQEIWNDFNASEYVAYDRPKNTDTNDIIPRIARWAEVSQDENEHIFLVSCLDNTVIGFTSLNKHEDGFEIGYGYKKKYQGKGYAQESMQKIIRYAKSVGANRLIAGTALDNIPSVNLLIKTGFSLVNTEMLSFFKDDNGNDIFFEGGNFEIHL